MDHSPDYRALTGAALVTLKTEDFEAALAAVRRVGAEVTRKVFGFPGGRRFQFREPGGTEMVVWSAR